MLLYQVNSSAAFALPACSNSIPGSRVKWMCCSAKSKPFKSDLFSKTDIFRNKLEVTYRDDAGIDREKLAEERKTLTTSFGSSRKVKMEERGQRRKVEKVRRK